MPCMLSLQPLSLDPFHRNDPFSWLRGFFIIRVFVCFAPQTAGLDMQQGVVGDMKALGVREAYKSKLQVREITLKRTRKLLGTGRILLSLSLFLAKQAVQRPVVF